MAYEDPLDYQLLHRAVLMQAVDDYVKLMHPKRRRKKHLALAWVSAAVCIFDEDFVTEDLVNEYNEPMTLVDLIKAATDRENVDVEAFRNYVVNEALTYWQERPVRTIKIPKNVTVEGHMYTVTSHHIQGQEYYEVDYDLRYLTLYKNSETNVEALFCKAITEIMAYHTDARLSKKTRDQLAESWYQTLRINNCFVGD